MFLDDVWEVVRHTRLNSLILVACYFAVGVCPYKPGWDSSGRAPSAGPVEWRVERKTRLLERS